MTHMAFLPQSLPMLIGIQPQGPQYNKWIMLLSNLTRYSRYSCAITRQFIGIGVSIKLLGSHSAILRTESLHVFGCSLDFVHCSISILWKGLSKRCHPICFEPSSRLGRNCSITSRLSTGPKGKSAMLPHNPISTLHLPHPCVIHLVTILITDQDVGANTAGAE